MHKLLNDRPPVVGYQSLTFSKDSVGDGIFTNSRRPTADSQLLIIGDGTIR